MARGASGTNPGVLRWARERSGHTLADVAAAFGKDVESIEAWEAGREEPTLAQLEKLAYQLYKRPLAVFFFPVPPEEVEPEREFRTLPDAELDSLSPDTRFALREAMARQLSLRELTGGHNPSAKQIVRELRSSPTASAQAIAIQIRDYLGVEIEAQASWATPELAFKQWRSAVESSGVFVFKRAFKDDAIDAFCLPDAEFPLIIVNNKRSYTRQQFSLFHELAHLLFATGGITKDDDSFIASLIGEARAIEVQANRVANQVLVPEADFSARVPPLIDREVVIDLAHRYHVSQEVILRRLLDRGAINKHAYEQDVERIRSEAKGRGTSTGGNYYATQGVYLSRAYAELVFSRYHEGRITPSEAAEHLRVKARNLGELEAHLFGGRSQ